MGFFILKYHGYILLSELLSNAVVLGEFQVMGYSCMHQKRLHYLWVSFPKTNSFYLYFPLPLLNFDLQSMVDEYFKNMNMYIYCPALLKRGYVLIWY